MRGLRRVRAESVLARCRFGGTRAHASQTYRIIYRYPVLYRFVGSSESAGRPLGGHRGLAWSCACVGESVRFLRFVCGFVLSFSRPCYG